MANTNVRDRYVSDGAGVVPQPRLLIMLYDRLVLDLDQATTATEAGHIAVANDKLIHAQSIILELHAALNHDLWAGSSNLASLYLWFNDQLIEANVNKNARTIRTCHRLIRELQVTWHRAYEQLLTDQAAAAAQVAKNGPTATAQPV